MYDTELEDAVNDIQKYVDVLELNEWLAGFRETALNYPHSKLPSDLAHYLSGYFDDRGGRLSASFYRVDDEDASTKRLIYDLELRYQDHSLYVFDLWIDEQSFEKGKWKKATDTTRLSNLSDFNDPEFGWIMDRLEGLVAPPTEKLWNEWKKEED